MWPQTSINRLSTRLVTSIPRPFSHDNVTKSSSSDFCLVENESSAVNSLLANFVFGTWLPFNREREIAENCKGLRPTLLQKII